MPDASYSTLANWDGRLSAPGSINGDEHPSGSRSSPSPPSASPRIDPAHSGVPRGLATSAMVAEQGRVVDSPNLLVERTESGAGRASEKGAAWPLSIPEHLGLVTDDTEQRTPLPTPPSLSRSQAHPVPPQKPTSKSSRPGLRSPTLGKRDHSRSRPPAQDDDADSLMDADGETDHESAASVYPIQDNTESSTSTANTTTRDSTETTIVTHTPPVHKREKPLSKGAYTELLLEVSRPPSAPPHPRASKSPSPAHATTPTGSLPPVLPTTILVKDPVSPTRKDRSHSPLPSSPLTSPDAPLCDLPLVSSSSGPASSSSRPTKKRRLNRAYVEVPPFPPWRRRASYRPASKLFEQEFEFEFDRDEGADMGVDYAAGLGAALNSVAAVNGRDVSLSPVRASSSGRPVRATRARARESLASETPSKRGASVGTSVSKRRGRLPASKSVQKLRSAVLADAQVKSGQTGKGRENGNRKGKGKERAQDVELEDDGLEDSMQEVRQFVEAKEEEDERQHSDDSFGEEEGPHIPADNLELFLPSVRIHIGTYPQAVDKVLYVAFQRLLIASKNSVWPPRSEQSVTSSPSQAPPVIKPATSSSSSPTATSPSSRRSTHTPVSASRPSSSSVPATANPPSQRTKPLPRSSRRPVNEGSALPISSRSPNTPERSVRPSEVSSAYAPRPSSHLPPAASFETITTATKTNPPPLSQHLLGTSQRNLPAPHRADPSEALSPSSHPSPSDARTDSQQSFDFTTLLTEFDAHPALSSVSTSPSQSQPSFPTLGAIPPSPPGGFKTLQHILTHFEVTHKPVSPPNGAPPHRDPQQNAPTMTMTMGPHMTMTPPTPTPGDRFLRSVGYDGTQMQCSNFFPWVLDHSGGDPGALGGTIDPSLLVGPQQPAARPPSMSPRGSPSPSPSPSHLHLHSHSHSHSCAGPVAGPSRIPDAEPELEGSSQSSAQSHSPRTPPDLGLDEDEEGDGDEDGDGDGDGDVPLSMRLQRQFPALSKDLPAVEVEARRPRRLTERALAMRHTLEMDLSDEDEDEDEDWEVFSRSSASPVNGTKGAGKDKGKGKGKGKAKDTAKTHQSSGAGKGKGKGNAGEAHEREAISVRELAAQPTFCHQCRNSNVREKMCCSTIRESGVTCGLRYCSRCIENRYPDMVFDPFAWNFVCPRCRDTCNCTQCCSRRGEVYISARVGKLPTANSAEALALVRAAEKGSAPMTTSRVVTTRRVVTTQRMVTPPAPKFDLVAGQFFGVIYGLEGERMGPGYMGEDSQRVVVSSREGGEKAKGAARGPVRRRRRPRYGKAVAYIGERRGPPLPPILSASASIPPPASSSVSQDPQEADTQIANDQATSRPPAAQPALASTRPITPPPRGRVYIGDRSVLDKGTYVPMDELIARALREEEEDLAWGGPLSDPPSTDVDLQDEAGVAHSTLDVQYAIAIALHTLQGSPRDQAKVAAADAVRS